jgi:hypothetical protein
MGVEYNTGTGLDWGRIREEFEAASSPQDLVHEAAAAKAIKGGANLAMAKAAGQAAVAKAFPELAAEQEPVVEDDEPDEDAA